MKKIILIFCMVSTFIMVGGCSNKPNLENAINKPNLENPTEDSSKFNSKELVDIYTIALDTFVPKEEAINIEKADYLAIDMKSKFFDNISQEGKQQILDYFKNKYNIEVMNESLNTLEEKGLGTKQGADVSLINKDKRGILVGILNEEIVSKTEVAIEGYWHLTPVAGASFRVIIVFKDGQWKLEKIEWMGVS